MYNTIIMIDKIINTKVVSIVIAVWMAFHIFIAVNGDFFWQPFATLALIGVVSYTLDSASARKIILVIGLGFLSMTAEFFYEISQGGVIGGESLPPAPGIVLWVVITLWALLAGTATYTGIDKSDKINTETN